MSWPSSTVPLRAAIMHALTKPTGMVSAIPQADLFVVGTPHDGRAVLADIKTQPSAWAVVRDASADTPTNEMSGERRLRVVVQITTHLWAGADVVRVEVERQLDRFDVCSKALLNALTYPGSLASDPDGNPTGLDGGSLRAATPSEYRSVGPDLLPGQRVLRITHFFTASVTLAR